MMGKIGSVRERDWDLLSYCLFGWKRIKKWESGHNDGFR
jgi:hypothetical protein